MPADVSSIINTYKIAFARSFILTSDDANPGTLLYGDTTYVASTSASTTNTTETDVITKKFIALVAPRDGKYVIRAVARFTFGALGTGTNTATTYARIQISNDSTVVATSSKDSVSDSDGTEDDKYTVKEVVATVNANKGDIITVDIVLSAVTSSVADSAAAILYHDPSGGKPISIYVEVIES